MTTTNTPFSLANDSAYQQWRAQKLSGFSNDIHSLIIDIEDISSPTTGEINELLRQTCTNNTAFYRFNNPESTTSNNKQKVHQLAEHLGLHRLDKNICADEDKLTSITVTQHEGQHQYIPYSNKQLSWHTDGYYNTPEQQINGMLLHCERPAQTGGESLLLDHDIAYILLRDENPEYIKAFMHPRAMTIPANLLNDVEIRAAQSGPVFSIHSTGKLHMRYSARLRNIEWQADNPTLEAVAFLRDLWKNGSPYILRYTLQANEGVICNNVLHCRTNFEDSDDPQQKRLLYRGRYLDRVIEH